MNKLHKKLLKSVIYPKFFNISPEQLVFEESNSTRLNERIELLNHKVTVNSQINSDILDKNASFLTQFNFSLRLESDCIDDFDYPIEQEEPDAYDRDGDPVYFYDVREEPERCNSQYLNKKYLIIKCLNQRLSIPDSSFWIYGSLRQNNSESGVSVPLEDLEYFILDINKLKFYLFNNLFSLIKLEKPKLLLFDYEHHAPLMLMQNSQEQNKSFYDCSYFALSIENLFENQIIIFSLKPSVSKDKLYKIHKSELLYDYSPSQTYLKLQIYKYLLEEVFCYSQGDEKYFQHEINKIEKNLALGKMINPIFTINDLAYQLIKEIASDSAIVNSITIQYAKEYISIRAESGDYEGKNILLIRPNREGIIISLHPSIFKMIKYDFIISPTKERSELNEINIGRIWIAPSREADFLKVLRIVKKNVLSQGALIDFINKIIDYFKDENNKKYNRSIKLYGEKNIEEFKKVEIFSEVLAALEEWKVNERIDESDFQRIAQNFLNSFIRIGIDQTWKDFYTLKFLEFDQVESRMVGLSEDYHIDYSVVSNEIFDEFVKSEVLPKIREAIKQNFIK